MPEPSLDVRARSVELVSLTPFFERFRPRLDGLGDDEYLWEPTPGCVTVQPGEVGPFVTGGPQRRGPLTTIAWRICHIGDFLRQERNWYWLGREPELRDQDIRHPMTALAAIGYVEASWGRVGTTGRVTDPGRDVGVGSVPWPGPTPRASASGS